MGYNWLTSNQRTPQDIGSGITSPNGTFTVKQVHVFYGIVAVVFEIKLTTNLNPGGHILEGLPYAKGRYINIVIVHDKNVKTAYMDGTTLILNASISSGETMSGCFSYVT